MWTESREQKDYEVFLFAKRFAVCLERQLQRGILFMVILRVAELDLTLGNSILGLRVGDKQKMHPFIWFWLYLRGL